MRTEYLLENQEDVIEVNDTNSPMYITYTSGTKNPLYKGDSLHEAAASLEMDVDELEDQLMGDGIELEATIQHDCFVERCECEECRLDRSRTPAERESHDYPDDD